MAASPLPREPLSGTCNAAGALTLKYRAPMSFYVHCYVAISVSAGSPTYAITAAGSSNPLVFGQGNQTQLGPILLQPGEVAFITVTGAGALATVVAQVLGWQATDPSELLPLLPIQPTAVSISNTLTPGSTVAAIVQPYATGAPLPTWGIGARSISQAFTAGQELPFIGMAHASTVLETLRIRRIAITIESNSVASVLTVRIVHTTNDITAGGALDIAQMDGSDPTINANHHFFTYPGIGTTSGAFGHMSYSLGISTSTTDDSKLMQLPIYEWSPSPDMKPLVIRSGVLEGWLLMLKNSGATTMIASGNILFTVG